MKISIIVPTYNRPKALNLCLQSLAAQSLIPHEVLIADDGSGEETRGLVKEMQARLQPVFPLRHVWQEDRGFRKPAILNETVRQASGEYLVFLDGDCLAHRDFIRAHAVNSAPDAILSGRRAEIGGELTQRILEQGTLPRNLFRSLALDALKGRSRRVEEAIIITHPFLRRLLHRDRISDDGVWGCNFSLYKSLFLSINGCDEDFLDGSIEDNDIGIRVLNQGGPIRSLRNRAVIYHLWHASSWSFSSEKYQHNRAILKRRIDNKERVCKNGIAKIA